MLLFQGISENSQDQKEYYNFILKNSREIPSILNRLIHFPIENSQECQCKLMQNNLPGIPEKLGYLWVPESRTGCGLTKVTHGAVGLPFETFLISDSNPYLRCMGEFFF